MYKIEASEYHEAIAILHNVIGLAKDGNSPIDLPMQDSSRQSTNSQLSRLIVHAEILQCHVTALGIKTAIKCISEDKRLTYFSCGQLLVGISQNFQNELSLRLVYAIDFKKAEFFEQKSPIFGSLVAGQFPGLAYDIEQAGKCYACELDTASAFHSLRCLEAALRAIARCLGIPDPTKAKDRNWGEALKPVKTEIDRRWSNSTAKMSGDGKEFDEIYGALAAIQNPYRNSTMHLDKKYSSAEAYYLMEMVKGIISRVASRMNEDGLPLA